jgi:hypothetical protein
MSICPLRLMGEMLSSLKSVKAFLLDITCISVRSL